MKEILNDRRWFESNALYHLEKSLVGSSAELKLIPLLLRLPLLTELTIIIIPIVIAGGVIFSFLDDKVVVSVVAPLMLVLGVVIYALLRVGLVRKFYGSISKASFNVSQNKIKFPPNFPTKEKPLLADKSKVSFVNVYWQRVIYSSIKKNRIKGIRFVFEDGRQLYYDKLAYPLQSLLYYMIKFQYPVKLIELKGNEKSAERVMIYCCVLTLLFSGSCLFLALK